MGPKSSAGGALCVSLDVCDDARRGAPASLDFADASVLPPPNSYPHLLAPHGVRARIQRAYL